MFLISRRPPAHFSSPLMETLKENPHRKSSTQTINTNLQREPLKLSRNSYCVLALAYYQLTPGDYLIRLALLCKLPATSDTKRTKTAKQKQQQQNNRESM